jgi:hypothetical protein
VELKKDVTIVVLGASGDLAKKKTVPFSAWKWSDFSFLRSSVWYVPLWHPFSCHVVCWIDINRFSFATTFCLPIPLLWGMQGLKWMKPNSINEFQVTSKQSEQIKRKSWRNFSYIPLPTISNDRNCQHIFPDNMIKMTDLSNWGNTSKNAKDKERIEIGMHRFIYLTNHRIFYMALPPNVFTPVAQGLKKNVYPEKGIARLIVPHFLFPILSLGWKAIWQGSRVFTRTSTCPRSNLVGRWSTSLDKLANPDIPHRSLLGQGNG